MKRILVLFFVAVVFLSSCEKADIIIRTDLENTRSSLPTVEITEPVMTAATNSEGKFVYIVNDSSKTFHLSSECRHVKSMSEKNRVEVVAESIEEMILHEYKPCSTCVGKQES